MRKLMMMKKLTMAVAVAFCCVVLGAGTPGAQAGMPSLNTRIAERIGLSAEVQQQIKQIEQTSRKTVRDLQQKTRVAMERQAKLMTEAKPDEAAVMAAIDELFELRKAMAKAQTKRVLSVKALLTPEQLEKALAEVKRAHDERRAKKAGADKAKDAPAPADEAK